MLSLLKQLFKRDFIFYCIVGIIGLLLDVSTYYLCYKVFLISYALSNIISSHVGILNNFILNSIFTFKATDKKIIRFLSFYGIAWVGMGISTLLILLFINKMSIHPMIAKFLALAVVTLIQFTFNKYVTFRKKSEVNDAFENNKE